MITGPQIISLKVALYLICFSCFSVRALPRLHQRVYFYLFLLFQKPVDLSPWRRKGRRMSESEARCRDGGRRGRLRASHRSSTTRSPRMRSNSNLCAPCTAVLKMEKWPCSSLQLVSAPVISSYLLRADIGAGTVSVSCFSSSQGYPRPDRRAWNATQCNVGAKEAISVMQLRPVVF